MAAMRFDTATELMLRTLVRCTDNKGQPGFGGYIGGFTPLGAGSGTGTHNPVATSSALPGRQNAAHASAPAVSPGRHAELIAGEKTMTPAISAAADNAAAVSLRSECV